MFNRKKLHFQIASQAGSISLTEALKGLAGTVNLSTKHDGSVYLWTPNTRDLKAEEVVCDLRFIGLSPQISEKFKQATAHLTLPAKVAVFQGTNPSKIEEGLQYFDYILIPSHQRNNDWDCLYKTKILGYTPPNITRLREVLSKKVH